MKQISIKFIYEAKYPFLLNKRESTGLKYVNDSKAFIEYSNHMDDIYENIEEGNPNNEMITDMHSNENLNKIVTALFIRGRKWNISLAFITQSCFKVPKDVRLNTTHFFIRKIPNERELKQIAYNRSFDVVSKDFINLCKKCIAKPYSFSVIDANLASDNLSRFRKNLLERI